MPPDPNLRKRKINLEDDKKIFFYSSAEILLLCDRSTFIFLNKIKLFFFF